MQSDINTADSPQAKEAVETTLSQIADPFVRQSLCDDYNERVAICLEANVPHAEAEKIAFAQLWNAVEKMV